MFRARFFAGALTMVILTGLMIPGAVPTVSGEDYYGEDPNKKILKNALLGAGVGAISAEASGGSAGKGALIGAGVNVIGGAVLDTLTSSPKPQQPQYQYAPAPQPQYQYQPQPAEYRYAPPAQQQSPYSSSQQQYGQESRPPSQYQQGSTQRRDAFEDDFMREEKEAKRSFGWGGCAPRRER